MKKFQIKKKRKINKLFKMKEFSQIFLGKRLFVSVKGHFCLTIGHLANIEEQVEIKSLSIATLLFSRRLIKYR